MTARLIRSLRGRSFEEIRDRVAQHASILVERIGPVRRAPGAAGPELPPPRLTASASEPDFAGRFRSRWPAESEAIVTRAERLLDDDYDLLGYKGLRWGTPPDWQLDPLSGKRAELTHWSQVPYLEAQVVGDHKVTWELNRHQWMVTLAQAWCLTAREEFAAHAATMLDDWLNANPPKRGINWASSLELAFRTMAWTRVLHLLQDARRPDAALRSRIVASLDMQGRHIERYLSTWFSPNTHLTGEALALLQLGVAFPALPRAARWRERGWAILEKEVDRQIRPDGVYFEQTSWYQGYTVDFYVHAIRLRWASGGDVPASLLDRVTRAAHALAAVVLPDGRIPLIGDDDGGRLLPLRPGSLDDFRDTLALASLVLGEPSLKPADDAPASALPWVVTPRELERYDEIAASDERPAAEAFPDGGWYVVRDSRSTLFLDGGPHGALSGAHAHADALSIVLAVDGRPVLTDSGTYTYMGDERNSFRGTLAHNTVEVDGEHSSEAGGPFRWEHFARSEVLRWFDAGGCVVWEGVHDGYRRLATPILHRRIVLWLRDRYGIICDVLQVEGAGVSGAVRKSATRFHGAQNTAIMAGDTANIAVFQDGADQALCILADSPIAVEEGWNSDMYGRRTGIDVAVVRREFASTDSSVTVLVPGASAEGPTSCARIPADGGEGWSFEGDGFHDRFLIRGGSPVAVERVEADVDICWLREKSGVFTEVVGVGSGSVRIDGKTVVTVRGGCARALRGAGGAWALEEI